MRKLKRIGTFILAFSLAVSLICSGVFASETTPYMTKEVKTDRDVEYVRHSVTDSEDKLVNIGEKPKTIDEDKLAAGTMAAQKSGVFVNEEDAEKAIVKLSFDVVAKPVLTGAPIDLLIIADESGSMNMYGRAHTYGKNISYMPCLNESHYYGIGDLQSRLYAKKIEFLKKEKAEADEIAKYEEKLKASKEANKAIYINPHNAGIENIVFKQWNNKENWTAVIKMVREAGVEIPEGLTGGDVYLQLFPDANSTPDKNHYYYDGDKNEYVPIKYVENYKTILEENGKYYSYWSPAYDNKYGCIDRMMLEKIAAAELAETVLGKPNNKVGYIGFTYNSYPSLCSGGFVGSDKKNELLEIIKKTEGHDYTNYAHALWTAKHYIENREDKSRPVYIVFISDGNPTRISTATSNEWSILTAPVKGGSDGDCLGYNEIYYGETNYSYNTAAIYIADELKKWYKAEFKDDYKDEIQLYTIGINTNDSANDMLKLMASDEDNFIYCEEPKALSKQMEENFPHERYYYPEGVLNDGIGEDFELFVDEKHPFTVSGKDYSAEEIENIINSSEEKDKLGGVVSFGVSLPDGKSKGDVSDIVSVSWEIDSIDEKGEQISYYVKLKSEELNKYKDGSTRIYNTNSDTKGEAGARLVYKTIVPRKDKTDYIISGTVSKINMWTPHVQIENGLENIEEDAVETGDPFGQLVPLLLVLVFCSMALAAIMLGFRKKI